MTCPAIDSVTREWTTEFRAHAAKARTPISATFELTRRCNFRCAHCYLGDQAAQHQLRDRELGTEAVKAALSEWVEAGCLYLTLTGGDPMMRPDFAEIYRHARELGMVVTVFCNGTLVTDEIIALFREVPPRKVEISIYGATPETFETVTGAPAPRKVEISIYGATPETFETVTGVRGSHARAWTGIRRLHEAGIRLGLKTLLLTTNQHEFEAMEAQAAELGVDFRHDAALFPCLADGSTRPLAFRVSPEEAVRHDVATPERRRMWREKIEHAAAHPEGDRLYTCSAGLTSFHADPFGVLSPCLMAMRYRYSPENQSFLDLWRKRLPEIRRRKRSRSVASFIGKFRGACAHCPAFNQLETGDEEQESAYMEKTTYLRVEAAMSPEAGEVL